MLRFAAGLLVGLALGGGGVYLALRPAPAVVTAPAPAPAPDAGHGRPRRGHRPPPAAGTAERDDEPVALTAADRQVTAAGDALRASDTVDMSGAEARALTQAEIDGAMAARADDLIRCIAQARGAASLAGRVVAGVVVDASGRVTRTRIEAPAYLLRHGLYDCARRPLALLRFPATGRETVVTVPFDVSE